MSSNVSDAPFGKDTVWLSVSLSSMHACAVYAKRGNNQSSGGILFAGVMTSEIRKLNLELTTYLGATLFFSFQMNLEY